MTLQYFPLEYIPLTIFASVLALIVGLSVAVVYLTLKNLYVRLKAKQFTFGQRMFLCEKSNIVISLSQDKWQYDGNGTWKIDCSVCKEYHPAKLLGGFL